MSTDGSFGPPSKSGLPPVRTGSGELPDPDKEVHVYMTLEMPIYPLPGVSD